VVSYEAILSCECEAVGAPSQTQLGKHVRRSAGRGFQSVALSSALSSKGDGDRQTVPWPVRFLGFFLAMSILNGKMMSERPALKADLSHSGLRDGSFRRCAWFLAQLDCGGGSGRGTVCYYSNKTRSCLKQ